MIIKTTNKESIDACTVAFHGYRSTHIVSSGNSLSCTLVQSVDSKELGTAAEDEELGTAAEDLSRPLASEHGLAGSCHVLSRMHESPRKYNGCP